MDDLSALEDWATPLIARLDPAQRHILTRRVAQDLRRSQARRIAAQRQPDGSAFVPRSSKNLRGKAGRIKRQMFSKLRTAKHLKIQTDENGLAIGFLGRVARIARVHQEGLTDRVSRNGPDYKYPVRELLGFSGADRELIKDSILRHLES